MKGIHYVGVFDSIVDGQMIGIVTSITLVKLLRTNIGVLGSLSSVPVERLFNTGAAIVKTAPKTATLRACFEQLFTSRFLGMPIVDESGTAVANLSMSDVRAVAHMSRDAIQAALDSDVLTYLTEHRLLRPLVAVRGADTLATVLELIADVGVHRVYIVDDARHPIGIITITDILKVLDAPLGDRK